jgi:ABC-type polysaccharide/polyol phosphate export permease
MAASVAPPERLIRPVKRRVSLADFWRSRPVARELAARDMKVKYKQSLVGPPWLIIQPLGTLAGLLVAFHGITKANTEGVPYVWFALVGMVVWTFFTQTLTNSVLAFGQNAELIRRVALPRLAIITASLLSNLLAPAVILVAVLAGLLISGIGLPTQALLFPLVVGWMALMTIGCLMILSSLAARYRDVNTLMPFWATAGPFLTPIGYSVVGQPSHIVTLLSINPLTGLIEVARWCLLGTSVQTLPAITAVAWTIVFVLAGWYVFSRMEVRFADFV